MHAVYFCGDDKVCSGAIAAIVGGALGWKSNYCCIESGSRYAVDPYYHLFWCSHNILTALQSPHTYYQAVISLHPSPCFTLHSSVTMTLSHVGCVLGDVTIVFVCASNIDIDKCITPSCWHYFGRIVFMARFFVLFALWSFLWQIHVSHVVMFWLVFFWCLC